MAKEKIVASVSVRSEDSTRKRLCDLGCDFAGNLYVIDVESDKNGKKKYVTRIDSYIKELQMLYKKQVSVK